MPNARFEKVFLFSQAISQGTSSWTGMRSSAFFWANNTIFVAMTWCICRRFQACLPILRCYRSLVHLEKSKMIYRLHELNHQLKTNSFDMMNTKLKVFTVSYLIWEFQQWNEKGLCEDRTAWRAQAQVHLSAGCEVQQADRVGTL